jgi:hypothetical protein
MRGQFCYAIIELPYSGSRALIMLQRLTTRSGRPSVTRIASSEEKGGPGLIVPFAVVARRSELQVHPSSAWTWIGL